MEEGGEGGGGVEGGGEEGGEEEGRERKEERGRRVIKNLVERGYVSNT